MMRTLVSSSVLGAPLAHVTDEGLAPTAPQFAQERFISRLVIVTLTAVSCDDIVRMSSLQLSWECIRLCRSSMPLLRTAGSSHSTTVTVPSLGRVCDTRTLGGTTGCRQQLGQRGSPGGGGDHVSSPRDTCQAQAQRESMR